ncbi:MAG: efflux RND transporter periplasmic adaptor subunit [Sedimentisphaeraceae bacterium JB056]
MFISKCKRFLLCVVMGLAAYCSAQQEDPKPVVVADVSMVKLEGNNCYPASIKASDTTQLSFRVDGPLVSVNVSPGDEVKSGDVLMQIDSRDFLDNIEVLKASLASAESACEKANRDFERAVKLWNQKVIPQADYDSAKNLKDTAIAQVKAITAQLQIADHKLEDTSLRAPYDGIITDQLVENYEMIEAGQVVLKMHKIAVLEIEARIPENEIVSLLIKKGVSGIVKLPAIKSREFEAELKEWSTAADKITRTYSVTFCMKAPDNVQVFPGMTAEIHWGGDTVPQAVATVPVSAIVPGMEGQNNVWVYDQVAKKAKFTEVELDGLVGSSKVRVVKGLKPSDKIVIEGVDYITSDMILDPINTTN